jgi:hypothetical protein
VSGGTGNVAGGAGPTNLPEPSSFVLLGLMAGGFLAARRWRRAPEPTAEASRP